MIIPHLYDALYSLIFRCYYHFCRHCRPGGLKWTSSHSPPFSLIRSLKHSAEFFFAHVRAAFLRPEGAVLPPVLPALVGSSGLEPPTSCLSGTRSNLLSYEPVFLFRTSSALSRLAAPPGALVEMKGIEPLTPCLQGRCSPS